MGLRGAPGAYRSERRATSCGLPKQPLHERFWNSQQGAQFRKCEWVSNTTDDKERSSHNVCRVAALEGVSGWRYSNERRTM